MRMPTLLCSCTSQRVPRVATFPFVVLLDPAAHLTLFVLGWGCVLTMVLPCAGSGVGVGVEACAGGGAGTGVGGVGGAAGFLPLPLVCGGVVVAAGREPCGSLPFPWGRGKKGCRIGFSLVGTRTRLNRIMVRFGKKLISCPGKKRTGSAGN